MTQIAVVNPIGGYDQPSHVAATTMGRPILLVTTEEYGLVVINIKVEEGSPLPPVVFAAVKIDDLPSRQTIEEFCKNCVWVCGIRNLFHQQLVEAMRYNLKPRVELFSREAEYG